MTHRDRLNDPAASSLDLDDEYPPDSSFNTPDTPGDTENEEDEENPSHRISVRGPKIRFHSRAPWEMGEDTIDENDSVYSGKSGVFGKKVAEAGLMRHFARGSSRPSADSSCSQALSQSSFETTTRCSQSSARGTLYTLAQESFSTSSLTVPSHQFSTPSPRNRHNFSLPRTANYPPSSDHTHGEPQSDSSSLRGMTHTSQQDTHSPHSSHSEVQRDHERSATLSSFRTCQDPPSHDDFVHPYANPNLVVSYSPPSPVPPLHSTFDNISQIDSTATVTDSSHSGSTMSPDTSSSPSRDHVPSTAMRIHGKDISHPIAVFHSNDPNSAAKLMPLHPSPVLEGVPGWNPNPPTTVPLISLQEAQARERTRSATVNSTTSLPSRVHEYTSRVPFPDPDDSASIASTETSATGRVRARTTSAGIRAKAILHSVVDVSSYIPERRDSEPAIANAGGQTLRHKRSGFMRLFNGREREKGRDKERSPPPPVPSLRRIYSEHPHGANEDGKPSLPVIPPRLSSAVSDSRSNTTLNKSSADAEQGTKISSPSLKRTPPPLYIATSTRSPASATSTLGQDLPQRAPADFLKLRPISTNFSSQFADIVAIPEMEPISELDLDTPTSTISSVPALSPFTSGSSRPSDDKPSPVEQSLIIKALQEQIISSKKAWQRQVWELQGQVRDLKAEVEGLRAADEDKGYCENCGRGTPQGRCEDLVARTKKVSVVDRSRGRIGSNARFASGNGN
ncbi:hypothetical protein K503DRAFT_795448 [Rhizopogon vinicolor AM-OR11-026]|uniref:Uncharacterized protein n=1 Tax=Rhizopogon vinicolor AM-OR11-026 TaxID=1314800 RepID=A0A1B7NHT8_9AGAM|nr:hypothetical protein K503DRAFT_795448 [Rhizopogon vinicolor AM-OR11-026]